MMGRRARSVRSVDGDLAHLGPAVPGHLDVDDVGCLGHQPLQRLDTGLEMVGFDVRTAGVAVADASTSTNWDVVGADEPVEPEHPLLRTGAGRERTDLVEERVSVFGLGGDLDHDENHGDILVVPLSGGTQGPDDPAARPATPSTWPTRRRTGDFTELNFIVEHVGLPRREDFCWIATQEPNVYGGLAVAIPFMHTRPRYFAEIMGEFLYWIGEDRILFSSDYALWTPKWLVERFVDFQIPEDMQPEYAAITTDQRKKILNLSAAALYDIPVPRTAGRVGARTGADRLAGKVRERAILVPDASPVQLHREADAGHQAGSLSGGESLAVLNISQQVFPAHGPCCRS